MNKLARIKTLNLLRLLILMVMIISLSGPWTFTSDGVPPPEWCGSPHILADNGRCVDLVSGWRIITFFLFALLVLLPGLLSGQVAFADLARELSAGVFILLLILPAILTGLSTIRKTRLVGFLTGLSWIAAIAPVISILQQNYRNVDLTRFWGIWAYCILALVGLSLEIFTLVRRTG